MCYCVSRMVGLGHDLLLLISVTGIFSAFPNCSADSMVSRMSRSSPAHRT